MWIIFFQNQGIGAALTGACIDCAKKAGFRQLELEVVGENETAVRLYKKYGLWNMEEIRGAF